MRPCSLPPPAPNSPRQSPLSPPRSCVAAAALPSEPQPAGNCAPQLASYLANQPPCLDCTRQDHPFPLSPRKTRTALRFQLKSAPCSTVGVTHSAIIWEG